MCVCVYLFSLLSFATVDEYDWEINCIVTHQPYSDGGNNNNNNNYTNTGENPSISMTQAFYDSSFFIVVAIVVGRNVSNTNLAQCPLYERDAEYG